MSYKVYIVYPDGKKRLAGGVQGIQTEETAEFARKYYEAMIRDGIKTTWKGCRVELVQS